MRGNRHAPIFRDLDVADPVLVPGASGGYRIGPNVFFQIGTPCSFSGVPNSAFDSTVDKIFDKLYLLGQSALFREQALWIISGISLRLASPAWRGRIAAWEVSAGYATG